MKFDLHKFQEHYYRELNLSIFKWNPADHPRDLLGRFRKVLSGLGESDSVELPDGTAVDRTTKGFVVSRAGKNEVFDEDPSGIKAAKAALEISNYDAQFYADPYRHKFDAIMDDDEGQELLGIDGMDSIIPMDVSEIVGPDAKMYRLYTDPTEKEQETLAIDVVFDDEMAAAQINSGIVEPNSMDLREKTVTVVDEEVMAESFQDLKVELASKVSELRQRETIEHSAQKIQDMIIPGEEVVFGNIRFIKQEDESILAAINTHDGVKYWIFLNLPEIDEAMNALLISGDGLGPPDFKPEDIQQRDVKRHLDNLRIEKGLPVDNEPDQETRDEVGRLVGRLGYFDGIKDKVSSHPLLTQMNDDDLADGLRDFWVEGAEETFEFGDDRIKIGKRHDPEIDEDVFDVEIWTEGDDINVQRESGLRPEAVVHWIREVSETPSFNRLEKGKWYQYLEADIDIKFRVEKFNSDGTVDVTTEDHDVTGRKLPEMVYMEGAMPGRAKRVQEPPNSSRANAAREKHDAKIAKADLKSWIDENARDYPQWTFDAEDAEEGEMWMVLGESYNGLDGLAANFYRGDAVEMMDGSSEYEWKAVMEVDGQNLSGVIHGSSIDEVAEKVVQEASRPEFHKYWPGAESESDAPDLQEYPSNDVVEAAGFRVVQEPISDKEQYSDERMDASEGETAGGIMHNLLADQFADELSEWEYEEASKSIANPDDEGVWTDKPVAIWDDSDRLSIVGDAILGNDQDGYFVNFGDGYAYVPGGDLIDADLAKMSTSELKARLQTEENPTIRAAIQRVLMDRSG